MRKSTLIMAVITALLFYILLQDLRTAVNPAGERSRFIFEIDSDTVTEITIIKNGEPFISASKVSDEDWFISYPIQVEAARFSLGPILSFISSGMYETIITQDGMKDFSLKRFGLEKPPLQILFTAGKKKYSFEVSPVRNEKLFIKRGDDERIFQAPPHFYNFFNKALSAYRSRTVFRFNDINVRRVELTGSKGFVLDKAGQDIWIIEKPFTWPGSPDTITAYLRDLKSIRIKTFVKDQATEEDGNEYGLGSPLIEIKLSLLHAGPIVLSVGKKDKDRNVYYFKDNSSGSIYTAPAEFIEKAVNVDIELFRNRNLGVFEKARATKILVDNLMTKQRVQLERTAPVAPWKCTWPEDETVEDERVNIFIKDFLDIKIINFPMEGEDKIKVFDLHDPDLIITFLKTGRTGRDEVIYRLNLKNKGLIYGYVEGMASVLRLPEELFTTLASGLAVFKSLYIVRGAEKGITWLRISGKNRVTFECKFTPERRWEIVEPTNKLANPDEIYATLNVLGDLKTERIVELNTEQFARYGFDDPQAVVSFIALGRKFTLLIGKQVPDSTESYITSEGSETVYTLAKEKLNEMLKDTGLLIKLKK